MCTGNGPAQTGRPRARNLGLAPGVFPPGALNAITDVAGVRVGHVTLVEGDSIRTGVTAIIPAEGNLFQEKVPGAVFVGNAFGKLAGSTQVEELGTIETPIVLTNTLNVGAAMEGVIAYTLAQPGNERVVSVNAVVGETNDGGLNDIRGMHVRRDHVLEAIRNARGGAVAEGSVGAGTGTICYGWKGGIGTSSRVAGRRVHRRRAGAEQFWRRADDGRGSGGPRTGAVFLCGRGQRGWVVHDRRGDRRSSDGQGSEAAGGAGGVRAGPDGIFLQQRQRGFCDCLFDCARSAHPRRARRPGAVRGARVRCRFAVV